MGPSQAQRNIRSHSEVIGVYNIEVRCIRQGRYGMGYGTQRYHNTYQIMGRIPLSLGPNNASIIIISNPIIMFDYFAPFFIRAIFYSQSSEHPFNR
jgi:hypothetical protein